MVRTRRIRVYNSLHGPFSKECRQPCIVFTGHPSLHIGEIVHLLDLWGGNSRNAIMMIGIMVNVMIIGPENFFCLSYNFSILFD
jgi:hypothetical protein